ncbi:hypothetical protein RFI_32631, partial [Reticulomyxa filosa]
FNQKKEKQIWFLFISKYLILHFRFWDIRSNKNWIGRFVGRLFYYILSHSKKTNNFNIKAFKSFILFILSSCSSILSVLKNSLKEIYKQQKERKKGPVREFLKKK